MSYDVLYFLDMTSNVWLFVLAQVVVISHLPQVSFVGISACTVAYVRML